SGVVIRLVGGVDEDREELCAEKALHAREVGLAVGVWGGDVIAVHGARWHIVVGVDEDGITGDPVDLGLGDGFAARLLCGGRKDERERKRSSSGTCGESHRQNLSRKSDQGQCMGSGAKSRWALVVQAVYYPP